MKMMMEISEGPKNDEMGGTVGERRRRWTKQEGLSLPEQAVHHRKRENRKQQEERRKSADITQANGEKKK